MNADDLSVIGGKAGIDVDIDRFKKFSIDNSWDETYGWSIGIKDNGSPTTETGNNEHIVDKSLIIHIKRFLSLEIFISILFFA